MHMNTQRVIVQVPMQAELKKSAEVQARAEGFSSLQEAIRVFLHKLSNRELKLTMSEPVERLSPKVEARYLRMLREIKKGKGITQTRTIDELMAHLDA